MGGVQADLSREVVIEILEKQGENMVMSWLSTARFWFSKNKEFLNNVGTLDEAF